MLFGAAFRLKGVVETSYTGTESWKAEVLRFFFIYQS